MDSVLLVVAFLLFVAQAVAWLILPSKVAPARAEETTTTTLEVKPVAA